MLPAYHLLRLGPVDTEGRVADEVVGLHVTEPVLGEAVAVLLPGLAKMGESLGDAKDPWSEIVLALPELLKEVPVHA